MGVILERVADDGLKVPYCASLEVWQGLRHYGGDVTCLVGLGDEDVQELQGGIGLAGPRATSVGDVARPALGCIVDEPEHLSRLYHIPIFPMSSILALSSSLLTTIVNCSPSILVSFLSASPRRRDIMLALSKPAEAISFW